MTIDTPKLAEPVASDPLRGDGVREALEATTYQLERVLNMMGLYHDDAAEKVLYRAKDALAALSPAPAVGEMADLVKRLRDAWQIIFYPTRDELREHGGLDTVALLKIGDTIREVADAMEAAAIERLASQGAERETDENDPVIERAAFEAMQWAKDPANNIGGDQPSLVFARRFAFLYGQRAPTSPLASPALGVGDREAVFALRGAFSQTTSAILTHAHATEIVDALEAAGFTIAALSPAPGSSDVERTQGVLVHTQAGTDSLGQEAWRPIADIKFDGRKIVARHRDGSETDLRANPEWEPEARRVYTHFQDRRPPVPGDALRHRVQNQVAGDPRSSGAALCDKSATPAPRDEPASEHKDLAPEAGVEGGKP